ncbi:MAG: ABC transporter substrate-binding protein, partial [Trebonia sp.]
VLREAKGGIRWTTHPFPRARPARDRAPRDRVTQLIVPRHYTRVAVVEDNAPGGLGNSQYAASLGPRYGFRVVATQMTTPGATDDTPQALNLLKASPQIIVLGMIPGPDTITVIKAIRSQDPGIPISECSGCATSQFVDAAGGASAMKNVYLIGTPENVLSAVPNTKANAAALADTRQYIAAMKAAGLGRAMDIDEGGEGGHRPGTRRGHRARPRPAHVREPARLGDGRGTAGLLG